MVHLHHGRVSRGPGEGSEGDGGGPRIRQTPRVPGPEATALHARRHSGGDAVEDHHCPQHSEIVRVFIVRLFKCKTANVYSNGQLWLDWALIKKDGPF